MHGAIVRLSRLFAYPDGFQHKGVQITEVLLYKLSVISNKIIQRVFVSIPNA